MRISVINHGGTDEFANIFHFDEGDFISTLKIFYDKVDGVRI